MTTATQAPEEKLLDLRQRFPSPLPLGPVGDAAARRFGELRFPGRKHEMFTFVNLRDLLATDFDFRYGPREKPRWEELRPHIYQGCENSVVVIVDGRYEPDFSDISGVGAYLSLSPLEKYAAIPANREELVRGVADETDVFACLATMFLGGGIVIEIAAGANLPAPLQILHWSTSGGTKFPATSPQIVVRAGAGSTARVVVKYAGSGSGYFINLRHDVIAGDSAQVEWTQVQADSVDSWHFSKMLVRLAKESRFAAVNAFSGNRLTRHHFECRMEGERSELSLLSASILENREQAHNYVRVYHLAPACTSFQHFKNIINNQGASSVDTTVVVHPGSQLTTSRQLINNLMLSAEGQANTKPNLMIHADDVKCNHGATTGRIDENQIFYLRSRGLSESQARSLIITSFVKSILGEICHGPAARDAERLLLKKLEAKGLGTD